MTVVVCDSNNNNQVSFRWIEETDRSSANGIPLFGIKFSGHETSEDVVALERSFDDEDCIFRGFLQEEPEVLVSLNGCPLSSTFDVNTVYELDINLYLTPLGQIRQFIENCGNPLCGRKYV